ncbi:MAG TPA: heparan-alpha-glucosaminide N-acetyltransferase domain-containing protein [Methyloceanibacter sp.]|nr:heparan-alpha-glucosaminide N-acetyltransferase domain-containing protein [Methyloceanibacter sp.]
MQQDATIERSINSPAASPQAATRQDRIASVDILRGLVMALMALDHTRDFFGTGGFNPRDVTEPALFLTRWITHFCAPTFIFLAGLSAFLYGRGRSTGELAHFLVTRGLFLILIDVTLIKFGWRFEADLFSLGAGVIFVIGASMIALAALIWLPRWALAAFALLMIAGHNLLDGIGAGRFGALSPLWHFLHQPGEVPLGERVSAYVVYPLIPWVGVMAAGYALGPVMLRGPEERQRILFWLGAAITLGFVVLRASNVYGDPESWTVQATWLSTLLSFLNCEKYPPSLLYLTMTLGPALMGLAAFEHARGRLADWLTVFGRVPFFFYVVHIYVIHALAVATGYVTTGALMPAPELGFDLPGVYLVWALALLLLYPLCRRFAALKAHRREWWWSYV